MTSHNQRRWRSQSGQTLNELLVLLFCAIVGGAFAIYMMTTHHKLLGIVAFPLGFCAGIYFVGSIGEIAVRCGRSRMGRTPGRVIAKALKSGAVLGAVLGIAFYFLAARGIIPTITPNLTRFLLSACLFGLSVAMTCAFLVTMQNKTERDRAPHR